MRVNIKITKPKSFRFDDGTPEVEGVIVRPAEIKFKMSGAIELGVLVELEKVNQVSFLSLKTLFLLLDSRDTLQKILQGSSAWADVYVVPNGAKEKVGGMFLDQELVKIGYGMIVRLLPRQ